MNIDRLAYLIKGRVPKLFDLLRRVTLVVTVARHGSNKDAAISVATIHGTVQSSAATIRPIQATDTSILSSFLSGMAATHLTYFHPHGFSTRDVEKVIQARDYCCYGLFLEGRMNAYCLIKLFPTRNAYCGLIASPELVGLGLGKFMWRYMIWQANLMELQPAATVHRDNRASLGSLLAVKKNVGQEKLANDYLRVTIPTDPSDGLPPELSL